MKYFPKVEGKIWNYSCITLYRRFSRSLTFLPVFACHYWNPCISFALKGQSNSQRNMLHLYRNLQKCICSCMYTYSSQVYRTPVYMQQRKPNTWLVATPLSYTRRQSKLLLPDNFLVTSVTTQAKHDCGLAIEERRAMSILLIFFSKPMVARILRIVPSSLWRVFQTLPLCMCTLVLQLQLDRSVYTAEQYQRAVGVLCVAQSKFRFHQRVAWLRWEPVPCKRTEECLHAAEKTD